MHTINSDVLHLYSYCVHLLFTYSFKVIDTTAFMVNVTIQTNTDISFQSTVSSALTLLFIVSFTLQAIKMNDFFHSSCRLTSPL